MALSAYKNVRAAIAEGGSDARVEVNKRTLINKFSLGTPPREPCTANSSTETTTAEIIITTSSSANRDDAVAAANISRYKEVATQVIYRNSGLPF